MRTAKQLVEVFMSMKPESKVWATWIDKEEVIDKVQEQLDNLDEGEGEGITAEKIVTDDFFDSVMDSLNNDDYLWERFGESFTETVYEMAQQAIKEIETDKELWDTETEKA